MKDDHPQKYAGYWIRRFLCEYLINVRNLSVNTLHSYRDAIRLLMSFAKKQLHKTEDLILLEDLSDKLVIKYLDNLEKERGCSLKTRNLRLAALASLARYVAANSPEHIEWSRKTRAIPVKKGSIKLITYLEKEEMDALLNLPDRKDRQGFRDYVLLLFMYNTGTRAEETATLTISNLTIGKGCKLSYVTVTGKGNKTRRCPLWSNTRDGLLALVKGRGPSENVFLNRFGQPFTRFGIYEIVIRYAEKLAETMPSVKKKRLTPHTIRHTTATHLLQSGVDINTIRAWLGHVSINTTNIYVEVNMQMKAAALEKCKVKDVSKPRTRWRDDKSLMDFLDSL